MMTIYSHSRLSSFEQCALKFKFRYIDKIKPEVESSIESHLGSTVHNTLEWLYSEVKKNKLPSLDDVIINYSEGWEKTFNPNFLIVKKQFTAKDYFNKGVHFLLNYYVKHRPFQDGTIELEKRIVFNLDSNGEYKMQGFIDRLVKNPLTGRFEIHDYKTANALPTRNKIETDRQLALYSIGIQNLFKTNDQILLVWHYLAHNMKIQSNRTNEQLIQLKQDTIELIKKIESTTEFPSNKTVLCGWCEYKSICPQFGGSQKRLGEFGEKKEFGKGLDIY